LRNWFKYANAPDKTAIMKFFNQFRKTLNVTGTGSSKSGSALRVRTPATVDFFWQRFVSSLANTILETCVIEKKVICDKHMTYSAQMHLNMFL